jgi:DNA (cytosine-5)-methyltransferase 1
MMNKMDFSKLSLKDLQAVAKSKNLKGISKLKKAEIISRLSENANQPDEKVSPQNEERHFTRPLKMVDLFAGTGAFSLAFDSTEKVDVVFANDFVKMSKVIYDANLPHHSPLLLKDINEVDVKEIPEHDILTGGFPCQPFSIAGLQEGFDDARSNVFWKILDIIRHHKPRVVLLENVKNLTSHDNCETFKVIQENLEACGYRLKYKVLNTSSITGVPQHRERIYIAGFREEEDFQKFSFDFEPVQKLSIVNFLQTGKVPDKYYYSDKSSVWGLVSEHVTKPEVVYQYRRIYVRENKNNECPTLTANMGTGGHNVPIIKDEFGIRKLTPRECFNLQGFPQSYKLGSDLSDSNLYKLAGNAVSYPVIKLIADRIISVLNV